jgi:diguanylate cyclase (GGDEF)-like protein
MRVGDLQDMLSPDAFKNVIFASKRDLEDLTNRVQRAAGETLGKNPAPVPGRVNMSMEASHGAQDAVAHIEAAIEGGWESSESGGECEINTPGGSGVTVLDMTTVGLATRSFASMHDLHSVALIVVGLNGARTAYASGSFLNRQIEFEIKDVEAELIKRLLSGVPLALFESGGRLSPSEPYSVEASQERQADAFLFPLIAGGEIRGALVVAGAEVSVTISAAIREFAQSLARSVESTRSEGDLEDRTRFAQAAHAFSKQLNVTEPSETYRAILRQSAEMLGAERGSLLLLDAASNELTIKAAVGMQDGVAANARIKMGEGISGSVMRDGRALMVLNADAFGCGLSHADRNYKSKSFISYPISIGGKKVGVLNVTDRRDGGPFNEYHLSLLETIGPQMALALDRAEWQEKAAQFQLMSITDALTGLLNRRYLEERLTEELNRSRRSQTPMSFVMLDIDDFKRYNDRNGHQAGDVALEITAQCLKSVLRSEDVAARYGGEEFSILLPQTSIEEANIIAQRLRQKIRNTQYPHGGSQPLGAVTVSIGVSSLTKVLDSPSTIIGAADRALYVAKSAGKNRVHLDEESYRAFLGADVSGSAKKHGA